MTREEAIEIVQSATVWTDEEREALAMLIPELRESEGERIRKELIDAFAAYDIESSWNGIPVSSVLSWLEKQKESLQISEICKENANSFTYEDERIRKAIIHYILYETKGTISEATEHVWVKWLEKQKEQPTNEEMIRTLRAEYEKGVADTIAKYEQKEQKPAEWSEDIIRKAVKEVGLTQRQIDWFKTNVFPPKQEWSEKDETCFGYALWCVTRTRYFVAKDACDLDVCQRAERWLESLHERFYLQPKQEWSEEDEHNLNSVISLVHSTSDGAWGSCIGDRIENWLKSLRPSWKPNEEQMEAFKSYIKYFQEKAEAAVGGWNNFDVMIRLFEQLKKL